MNKELIKKDFFEAVNGQWLEKTNIPEDKYGIGSFSKIADNLDKLKKNLLEKWSVNTNEIRNEEELLEMVKFYRLAKDWKGKKVAGVKPILPLLEEIEQLQSWEDVENNAQTLAYRRLFLPFDISVDPDFKDSKKQIANFSPAEMILPEKSYYDDETKKKQLLAVYTQMMTGLLTPIYKDEAKVKDLIQKALTFDELVAKYNLTSEEIARYTELYHLLPIEEFNAHSSILNIKKIVDKLVKNDVKEMNAVSVKYLNNIDKIVTKKSFENYKARLILDTVLTYAQYLDNQSRELAGLFRRTLSGVPKPYSKEKYAVSITVDGFFSMPFGFYYGRTYFGEEAKADVLEMVKEMINIYKEKLSVNEWLGKETIKKAITKLNKITPHIGYPSKLNKLYKKFVVKSYDGYNDFFMNALRFTELTQEHKYSKYLKPIEKEDWHMSPAMVNAYFSPSRNEIVFPAAILQDPFYSINRSSSENFGAIGVVMAHEISHAFDNNGAEFDENGNMNNWWTKEDKKMFDEKKAKMIELFDGERTFAGKCNGKLTVSENIADSGGLSCAYEAAKLRPEFKAKKFFTSYAVIWRSKYREKIAKLLLDTDVHAPAKLRVNVQLKNFDPFYEVYGITSKDKMYIQPKKRVKIW
ncbi:M13 family metallopeptidase [[Mycoplasma] falconis]|uniref:M13 family metallopeptidase n=1 Tax=[Mycoplasma] falconis TaxID=92403 RepID=A0A501XBG2_9BACT|nr:M13 family metallopeptidase [[Mycoplasma] falconis]TPE57769.1 M13 family metallopeptidase [[Mycoplasma] falconis]